MRVLKYLIISVFFIFISCKKDSNNSGDDSPAEEADSETLSGFGKLTGTLMVSTDGENQPASNAKVQIASHPEYDIVTDDKGFFEINNVSPGTLTIYAESTNEEIVALTSIDGNKRSAQFKDIVVSATGTTTLPDDVILRVPGSLSGKIQLINNPENVELIGTKIYVPGTSFSATADKNGIFALSDLPAGVYDSIRFDQSGLSSTEVYDVTIESGQNVDLRTIYMSLSTGPSGSIIGILNSVSVDIKDVSSAVLKSNTVNVSLLFDSRATLMKIAHESSFINVDWLPVSSSFVFTEKNNPAAFLHFSSDGSKSVFVKFSDQAGLESSVYQKDFIIDTEVPVLNSFALAYGWDQVASTATGMQLDILGGDSGTGVAEMKVCNANNFPSCGSWEPYALIKENWVTSANVYIRLRDFVGNVSEIGTDSIQVGSHTTIAGGTYSSDFVFQKSMSPYSFDADLTFEKNLLIEAGVTLDHASGVGYRKITVAGQLKANGTAVNPIVLTSSNNRFSGFDLSNSTVNNNSLSYFSIGQNVLTPEASFVKIDGGVIENNTITMANFERTTIEKNGYKALKISGNTFTGGKIKITQGTSTIVTDNSFVGSLSYVINITGGTDTIISYNTINTSSNAASTPTHCLVFEAGNATLSYNDISYQSTDTGVGSGLNLSGGGTVTAIHNNWNITNSSTADNILHLLNASSTINADFNYYTGHSTTNPNNSGGGITSTNDQGSSWTNAPSGDCVGSSCN